MLIDLQGVYAINRAAGRFFTLSSLMVARNEADVIVYFSNSSSDPDKLFLVEDGKCTISDVNITPNQRANKYFETWLENRIGPAYAPYYFWIWDLSPLKDVDRKHIYDMALDYAPASKIPHFFLTDKRHEKITPALISTIPSIKQPKGYDFSYLSDI